MQNQNLILNERQILQKIRRIAYQIYENNFDETHIVFAGIEGSGYTLAKMLLQEFSQISKIETTLAQILINKQNPSQSEIQLVPINKEMIKDKVIILCDDVLNTGKTLVYSLRCFINTNVKKIQTAVLVDRQHHNFPISADYVGYQLATTLQEHVKVTLNESEKSVYLF
ncbi:MAG: phosphoribosyltransferase family protein [Microscillaceae bacterium]|nr:phosphoribosyltransferase family protein [Microscillaceae bacterium]MDW8460342.1 phosphoribosyltransferase family protein [Cytophagales bacterium]